MDAITTFRLFTANIDRTRERITQDPVVSRDVEYYRENINSIKSPEEFVENRRLLEFALSAYGLEDMVFAKALIRDMLIQGPDERTSLANQLADPRYLEFAEDFDFPRFGAATTSFSKAQEGVIDKFYQQRIETEAGNENVGARLAIYFERKVDEISSPLDVLGDRALTQVFQTALGLPQQMSLLPLERQEEILRERVDFDDLSNPESVEKFTNRFIALWDLQNPNAVSVPPLISTAGSQQGVSFSLIASLQSIRSRT